MRVKISYTVEFDDVPKVVNDKLNTIVQQLENTADGIAPEIIDDRSILQTIESIDKARQHLTLLDAQLEDCYSILAGYNKALADMKMPKQEGTDDRMADKGRTSVYPAEGSDNKV